MKSLRIGLLGYGRMGQMIEQLAPAHGAEVIWTINSSNRHTLAKDLMDDVDVIIEMTRPDAALENIILCLKHDKPVVTGTTGVARAIAPSLCTLLGKEWFYALCK